MSGANRIDAGDPGRQSGDRKESWCGSLTVGVLTGTLRMLHPVVAPLRITPGNCVFWVTSCTITELSGIKKVGRRYHNCEKAGHEALEAIVIQSGSSGRPDYFLARSHDSDLTCSLTR